MRLRLVGEFEALPDLSHVVNKFQNLSELYIKSDLELKTVHRAQFAAFKRMEHVQLESCGITELATDSFDDLKDVREIDLQNNKLKDLPLGLLRNTVKLRRINFSNNKLSILHPDVLQDLQNLTFLDLSGNELEILPDRLFQNNVKLETIFLHSNKLKILHRDLFQMTHNLIIIYLYDNELENLPDGLFRNNIKLAKISLQMNFIKILHRDLFQETRNLKDIALSINQLKNLPAGLFRNNQNLTLIELQYNKIGTIECDFSNLPNLLRVNLIGNICIDEVWDVVGNTSLLEMGNKIRNKCPISTKVTNSDGCACSISKYGCCPDGRTEAQGSNFIGCGDIPKIPQKSCSLPKDSGTCNNFTVNHFFDLEYGKCSRFWYSGCGGNDNRFETIEECEGVCERADGKNACFLPKSRGPCTAYSPSYFFDSERNICSQFRYGGCAGNNNRFDTLEACQEYCIVDKTLRKDKLNLIQIIVTLMLLLCSTLAECDQPLID